MLQLYRNSSIWYRLYWLYISNHLSGTHFGKSWFLDYFLTFSTKAARQQIVKYLISEPLSENRPKCVPEGIWDISSDYIFTNDHPGRSLTTARPTGKTWTDLNIFRFKRYTRIWSRMPSNFTLTIFSKVYHTFGYTRASYLRLTDKRRPPREPRGNSQQIWWDRLVIVG